MQLGGLEQGLYNEKLKKGADLSNGDRGAL
jgi:hypothetical protein